MKYISYIDSILDMESPPVRKRVLAVKGSKALREEKVTPTIELTLDPALSFMAKAIEQICTSIKAKRIDLPQGVPKTSKYKPKIM